jgi:hypothetical protein
MPNVQEQRIACSECKSVFNNDELNIEPEKRKPCPNCGSLQRNIHVAIHETIALYDSIGIKGKKAGTKHKNNRVDYESEQGIKRGKNGRLVFKKKLIDREHPNQNGSYVEYVRDEEGNIIVNKSERLTEHTKKSINNKRSV